MLPSGTNLGPYAVIAAIGSGGMGEVYRAHDPRLRREVAIKVLPAGLATDRRRLDRFQQEALAAARLNHPNILAVYDIGFESDAPFIVSELLQGATLRDVLLAQGNKGARLPVSRTLDYAVQIVKGLAAAHDVGIVHRDLKPENLFVTHDGRVKILDFGLAKLTRAEPPDGDATHVDTTSPATEAGMILGTVGYMAPEQVRGEMADHRADIFSFALVLYEMLAGNRAFSGPSNVETLHAILVEEPRDLAAVAPDVPAALGRIIRRCLEKRPDDRFQSARDLVFSLEAISSGAEAPIVSGPAPRKPRPKFAAAIVAGLVAAAGLAGFTTSGFIARDTPPPTFTRLTYRRGTVIEARFAPDGQTIAFTAAWQGARSEMFSSRIGGRESRSLGSIGSRLLSISSTGEMALRLPNGTLARASLAGGAPRELVESVVDAAWAADGQTLAIVRDAASGKRQLELPVGTVLYETAGQLSRIAIAPDGMSVAAVEAPGGLTQLLSISLIDRSGSHTTLSTGWRSIRGLTWSPRGDEIWFVASRALFGAGTVFAVTPAGRSREVLRMTGDLDLYDASADGRILLGRTDLRLEARGLVPDSPAERDLSWSDYTGLSDFSDDGRSILITDDGQAGIEAYLRKNDGSPAIKLADAGSMGLSPDGRSILVAYSSPSRMGIVPIGPGEGRQIPHTGFESFLWANWFPDGKRILVAGNDAGHDLRLYVMDLDGGGRRAIAPEGTIIATGSRAISPDGRFVAAMQDGRIMLYPVDGGAPRALPGVDPGSVPSRWSQDGRFLYVYRRNNELPARVFRVDVATGDKELWKEVGPSDVAGVRGVGHVMFTPDGKWYVYNYRRALSDLYLVTGLK